MNNEQVHLQIVEVRVLILKVGFFLIRIQVFDVGGWNENERNSNKNKKGKLQEYSMY